MINENMIDIHDVATETIEMTICRSPALTENAKGPI